MIAALIAFFKALPELLRLVRVLEDRAKEAGIQRKVADDVKTIHEAFNAKDPKKLNELFNGK